METVEYKNISFTVWDVGGQDKVFRSTSSQILLLFIHVAIFFTVSAALTLMIVICR